MPAPLGLCSTHYASHDITAENQRPFSKAAPRKKAASNRTRRSLILTDSPVMAALANKKEKGSMKKDQQFTTDTSGREKKQTPTQTRETEKGTEGTTTQTRTRGKGTEETTTQTRTRGRGKGTAETTTQTRGRGKGTEETTN